MNMYIHSKMPAAPRRTPWLKCLTGSAIRRVALVAAGIFLLAPLARAQTTVAPADEKFILAAAQGGMTEVKLGQLAAEKATRDDVKAFGQMMVNDHTSINSDLKAVAGQKGITLPESLDAKHQGLVDKLTALAGSDFDDAYIAAMIKGHKMDAKAFKAEAADTKDADIKTFLDKSLPVVEDHLMRIKALKK